MTIRHGLKVGKIIGGLILASIVIGVKPSYSASVVYADPMPHSEGACDGGIPYHWTVNMNGRDHAEFVWHVGAKSWNEPAPPYEPPYTGWTHASSWTALELKEPSLLEIKVERQGGVAYRNNAGDYLTARDHLVPAFSIYSGWQNSGCEQHRYNNAGNTPWADEIEYIGNEANERGNAVITYRIRLDAGKYSLVIGGSPKPLEEYPANNCDVADPICHAYTGRHGYEAQLTTFPLKIKPVKPEKPGKPAK